MKITILYGFNSTEAEVSLWSFKSIYKTLKIKYAVEPILITDKSNFATLAQQLTNVDLVFIAGHGQQAEDGLIQSFLTLLKIPFTGTSALSSSLIMDKIASKAIIGKILPVIDFVFQQNSYSVVSKNLNCQHLIVKPSCGGSSKGISLVSSESQYQKSLHVAICPFDQCSRILAEPKLETFRELQIGVLVGQTIELSTIGEILLDTTFYDFETKYQHNGKKKIQIPAKINNQIKTKIEQYCYRIIDALSITGYARIDFFLVKGKIYFNEANSLPGLTEKSMFPLLWQYQGVNYDQLLDKIIDNAVQLF